MNEITRDWLETWEADKAAGKTDNIFWRLAASHLPLGVDPDEPEVQAVVNEMRERERTKEPPWKVVPWLLIFLFSGFYLGDLTGRWMVMRQTAASMEGRCQTCADGPAGGHVANVWIEAGRVCHSNESERQRCAP